MKKAQREYLVQVPAARGSVILEMDLIEDDFPAFWEPMTAIMGRSISAPTLHKDENMPRRYDSWHSLPNHSYAVNYFQNPLSIRALDGIG